MEIMKTKIYFQLFAVLSILAGSMSATAQELNESLTVEGDYDATVRHQERINMLPTRITGELPKASLPFASAGVPSNSAPSIFAMPATAWQSSRTFSEYKGYLDFGIGSYLNIVGSAGYRFIDNEKSIFGVMLQHNSSSLFSPFKYEWNESQSATLPDEAKRVKSDSRISFYASHDFGIGRLNADISYHYDHFNYYGVPQETVLSYGKIPAQNLNDFRLSAVWNGSVVRNSVDYKIGVAYHYFGYNQSYLTSANDGSITPYTPQKENRFTLDASISKCWKNESWLGLNFSGDYVGYTKPEHGQTYYFAKNYANFLLTPYYEFNVDNLSLHVGANIDITTDTHSTQTFSSENNFSGVHLSPDVKLGWRIGNVGLYAQALGGVELKTLAMNSHLDYYQCPQISSTMPFYSPVDARIGVNFRPFQGFTADISAVYKVTKNVPNGATYISDLTPQHSSIIMDYEYEQKNISGFSIAADLKYEYSDRLTLQFTGSYQPQDLEDGYFNGYDRPRWILDTKASVRVWDKLYVNLGYQYRGVRNLYFEEKPWTAVLSDAANYNSWGNKYRLPDIYLLNAGASYTFLSDRLTVWVQANNILGSQAGLSPYFDTEGFNVLAGFGVNF